jgi:hypothetical protein
MKKQLLLLTALALTSGTMNAKVRQQLLKNPMIQMWNAICSYNETPTATHRTNFDNALQRITELKNKQWVRGCIEEVLGTAKWYDDIYMNLELIGAGGHMMADTSKCMQSMREEEERKATLSKKAKQYGFKGAEYAQLLDYTFMLGESNEKRDQKEIDAIARMLISKKSADKKKGMDQLREMISHDYSNKHPMSDPKK